MAARRDDLAERRDDLAYSVIAARRMQWDNLVWQVPLLSLTAQAFLFTIALGGDSSRLSRVVSSLLSLVVTTLCMALMARHRQSELFDAHLLELHEATKWRVTPTLHGSDFAALRDTQDVKGGWTEPFVLKSPGKKTVRAYQAWILGLGAFGLAALSVLFITAFFPALLNKPSDSSPPAAPITVAPSPPAITFAPTIMAPTPAIPPAPAPSIP